VLDGINLPPNKQANKHGQYTHAAILLLQKGIWRVLIGQFNLSDPSKGMEKLPTLIKIYSDAITARSMIKSEKKLADKLSTMTSNTVLPVITTRTDAQEEASQLKVINQLVVGAGIVEAITKLIGSNITDTIL
jgi:hypothetical protein